MHSSASLMTQLYWSLALLVIFIRKFVVKSLSISFTTLKWFISRFTLLLYFTSSPYDLPSKKMLCVIIHIDRKQLFYGWAFAAASIPPLSHHVPFVIEYESCLVLFFLPIYLLNDEFCCASIHPSNWRATNEKLMKRKWTAPSHAMPSQAEPKMMAVCIAS